MSIEIKCGERKFGGVPTHYEINVAKDHMHLFATHERSIPGKRELDKVMEIFRQKFPEEEGYTVTVTAEYSFAMTMDEYQIGKRGW